MAVSGTSGSSFQISGIASGLDTDGIIEQLLNIERIPIQTLDTREADLNSDLAAWRSFNTRLLALKTSTSQLASGDAYRGRSVTTSDEEVAKATVKAGSDQGTFNFTVEQLATHHQTISQGFSDKTSSVGQGTVTIQVGTAQYEPITLDSDNSTLEGLRDAVNAANIGVSASILDAGESAGAERYRLMLNSNTSGTAAEMQVTFDLSGGEAPTLSDLEVAQDAQVVWGSGVNAVTLESHSNTFEDILPGLTLDLKQAKPGVAQQITLKADRNSLRSRIDNLIANYNATADFFSDQFAYDDATGSKGQLFGDNSLLNVQNQLVREATGQRQVDGKFNSLAQIGIGLDDTGHLYVSDGEALDSALESSADLEALLTDPDRGIITGLEKLIDETTSFSTGLISRHETVIKDTLTEIGDKRLTILRRVDSYEFQLRKQFADMETVLSNLQSQSAQITAQLGGLLAQA